MYVTYENCLSIHLPFNIDTWLLHMFDSYYTITEWIL